jgi:hypothetical protein
MVVSMLVRDPGGVAVEKPAMHPHQAGANDMINAHKAVLNVPAAAGLGGQGTGQHGGGDGDGDKCLVCSHGNGPPLTDEMAVTFRRRELASTPHSLSRYTKL